MLTMSSAFASSRLSITVLARRPSQRGGPDFDCFRAGAAARETELDLARGLERKCQRRILSAGRPIRPALHANMSRQYQVFKTVDGTSRAPAQGGRGKRGARPVRKRIVGGVERLNFAAWHSGQRRGASACRGARRERGEGRARPVDDDDRRELSDVAPASPAMKLEKVVGPHDPDETQPAAALGATT